MLGKLKHMLLQIPLALRYGIILAIGLILLKTFEYQFFSYKFSLELYTGLIAAFFMLVGLAVGIGWLNSRAQAQREQQQAFEVLPVLTVKEQQLLDGLGQGLSNQQLADNHHISVNTIKTHLKNLYKKLGVSSRAEAVARVNRAKR